MLAADMESPYADWIANWGDRPEGRITTRVPCADYFGKREQALLAHATQVDPDGNFFRITKEMQAKVWPTEDFDLTLSYVQPGEGVEDDLFAGLGSADDADQLATTGDRTLVVDDVREREEA